MTRSICWPRRRRPEALWPLPGEPIVEALTRLRQLDCDACFVSGGIPNQVEEIAEYGVVAGPTESLGLDRNDVGQPIARIPLDQHQARRGRLASSRALKREHVPFPGSLRALLVLLGMPPGTLKIREYVAAEGLKLLVRPEDLQILKDLYLCRCRIIHSRPTSSALRRLTPSDDYSRSASNDRGAQRAITGAL